MHSGERKKRPREQSGFFHIILISNFQNLIFNDPLERYQFLRYVDKYVKKYGGKLYAFCLMNTHIHLFIRTDHLSEMMQCILHDYSLWYNKRHGQKGSILRKPFTAIRNFHNKACWTLYVHHSKSLRGRPLLTSPHYFWSSCLLFLMISRDRLNTSRILRSSAQAFLRAELCRVAAINQSKRSAAYEQFLSKPTAPI